MYVGLTARWNPPAPIDLTARRKSLSSGDLCNLAPAPFRAPNTIVNHITNIS